MSASVNNNDFAFNEDDFVIGNNGFDINWDALCADIPQMEDGEQVGVSSGSINVGKTNQMTTESTATAPATQGFMLNPSFWKAENLVFLQNGEMVTGTNSQLWAKYEELHTALIGMFESGHATTEAQPMVVDMMNSQYPQPPTNMSMHMQATPYPQAQADAQGKGTFSPLSGYPTPSASSLVTSPTPGPAPLSKATAGKKRKRGTPNPTAGMSLPAYRPNLDLSSAAQAREYLSRFDADEAHKLVILNDDVPQVKGQLQVLAAKAYRALLHPYDGNAITDDRHDAYLQQQNAATAYLQKTLTTPAQLKAAQASCILLIDAAIAIHEHGVSRDRYRKHTTAFDNEHRIDDSYMIALDLTCSQRVEQLIRAVKGNKLVARDVLEQKNLLRFAECPEAYPRRKGQYLRSNTTRQNKVDDRAAEDEAKGILGRKAATKRRAVKKARYVEEDDDEEEEEFEFDEDAPYWE